jgi:hypothetical protein
MRNSDQDETESGRYGRGFCASRFFFVETAIYMGKSVTLDLLLVSSRSHSIHDTSIGPMQG